MAGERFRVLLAENSFTQTGVTLRSLCAETGRSLELKLVSSRDRISPALTTYHPDVALLDLCLLQPDAPAAVGALHRWAPHIPLIVFAPDAEQEAAERCLHAGATDFILLGYMDARTLERVLHAALDAPRGASGSKGFHDPLTGLVNRLGLLLEARASLQRPLGAAQFLVSVRLENFEAIRMATGRAAMESILKRIAVLLRKSVRHSDVVAYVGTGRFFVFVLDIAESWSFAIQRRVADRLLQLEEAPVFVSSEFLPAGTSFDAVARVLREGEAPSWMQPAVPRGST